LSVLQGTSVALGQCEERIMNTRDLQSCVLLASGLLGCTEVSHSSADAAVGDARADSMVDAEIRSDAAGDAYCGDDVPCCPDAWVRKGKGPTILLQQSFIARANEGAVLWKGMTGVTGDDLCREHDEPTGSRSPEDDGCRVLSVLRTEALGVMQEQRSTLAPDTFDWLDADTPLTLSLDGTVALDQEGRLVWAILRTQNDYDYTPAMWLASLPDGWSVFAGEPHCRRFSAPCWLYDIKLLEVETPEGVTATLPPGEEVVIEVDAMRYRIRNASITQPSELLPAQCTGRFGWSWEIIALGPV
jgi:hypothetical protein